MFEDLIQETEKELKECIELVAIFEDRISTLKQCQTIAEEQRQKIIKEIIKLGKNSEAYYSMIDKKNHIDICIEDLEVFKQQLNPAQARDKNGS
jgi:hypothetical protein